ncbi:MULTISPECIES: META domain-containing protein [Psychrobacter]|uniref:META domain-containing protein n=1 Tax=Psychrobacter TaxID=497 RepID=UPI00146F6908|nr:MULTISPECIES: META domain-containing protein [Psychrobacter]
MKHMTKLMLAGVFTVGALAAGCQSAPSAATPVTQTVTSSALQAYNWQLIDAKRNDGSKVTQLFFDPAKPLILNFMTVDSNNRVAFLNTCNKMSANYSAAAGNVQLGNIISTRMACPEPQASFDAAVSAMAQGKFSLSKDASNLPVLTITNANQVAHFKAISK